MSQAKAEVKLDGKALPEGLVVDSVSLVQPMFDHHRCRLVLSGADAADSGRGEAGGKLEGIYNALGKQVEVRLGSAVSAGSSEGLVFKGLAASVEGLRLQEGGLRIHLEAVSPTMLLETGPRNRIWEKKSFKDIAAEVLEAVPSNLLSRDLSGIASTAPIAFEAQYQESDFHFLCRAAQREQVWVFFDGETLRLTSSLSGEPVEVRLGRSGAARLESFGVAARCSPGKFRYRSFVSGSATEAKKSETDVARPGGLPAYVDLASGRSLEVFGQHSHAVPVQEIRSEGDADRHARAFVQSWLASLVEARGECEWIGLRPGRTIDVKDAGEKENGHYVLTRVEHGFSLHGGYVGSFAAVPLAAAKPIWDRARSATPSVQHAIVTKNYDKDHPGQVKIQYCHYVDGTTDAGKSSDGHATTTWVRVASPYAGKGGGFFAVPEEGDEVLVAHVDGRADQPVVVASLYNGKGSQVLDGLANDIAANDGKAFRTRAGNMILIRDTGGKERIEITTPGSKNRISLTVEGGTRIEMETEGRVTVKAKGAVGINAGGDIALEAKGDISLKSRQVKVAGSTLVEIKGAMIKLN